MQSTDAKYFESGFMVITTGETGSLLLGLQDISLSYTVEVEELLVFENNFSKLAVPTFKSWTASCGGMFIDVSGEGSHPQSADTYVTGGQSAAALFEVVKERRTDQKMIVKLGTANYQVGDCLLTSFEITSSAGQPLTFSMEITGTSDLVKATS